MFFNETVSFIIHPAEFRILKYGFFGLGTWHAVIFYKPSNNRRQQAVVNNHHVILTIKGILHTAA